MGCKVHRPIHPEWKAAPWAPRAVGGQGRASARAGSGLGAAHAPCQPLRRQNVVRTQRARVRHVLTVTFCGAPGVGGGVWGRVAWGSQWVHSCSFALQLRGPRGSDGAPVGCSLKAGREGGPGGDGEKGCRIAHAAALWCSRACRAGLFFCFAATWAGCASPVLLRSDVGQQGCFQGFAGVRGAEGPRPGGIEVQGLMGVRQRRCVAWLILYVKTRTLAPGVLEPRVCKTYSRSHAVTLLRSRHAAALGAYISNPAPQPNTHTPLPSSSFD